MRRASLVTGINHYLTHLRMSVKQLNGLNLQDLNVHAEPFFRDFLNLALGYRLTNINIVEPNAQAIDLGDKSERIAIQVTSTPDLAKIRHTHQGFVRGGFQAEYDRLIMLIVGEKNRYRDPFVGEADGFRISLVEDVWDMNDLLRRVVDKDLPTLERCHDFLREELRVPEPKEANEVLTLVRLIEVLSIADVEMGIGDNREDPDPKRKIHDRFADHAEFLESLFVDLHEIYGRTLAEVNRHADLGHMKIRKLQLFLMNRSDRFLAECGGDPQAALDALLTWVVGKMGSTDVPFDDGAIRYYLIDQLIACNVFPNKRPSHA